MFIDGNLIGGIPRTRAFLKEIKVLVGTGYLFVVFLHRAKLSDGVEAERTWS
ncbi:MAG: hypothetical protein ACOX47_06720 [Bacillota bacterium]